MAKGGRREGAAGREELRGYYPRHRYWCQLWAAEWYKREVEGRSNASCPVEKSHYAPPGSPLCRRWIGLGGGGGGSGTIKCWPREEHMITCLFFFSFATALYLKSTRVSHLRPCEGVGERGGALHNTSEHGKCEWTRWRALATTSPAGNKRLEAGSSSLVIYRTSRSIFSPSEKLSGQRQGTRKTGKKEARIERGTDTIFTKDYFPLFWKQMLGRVFKFLWSYWSAKKKKRMLKVCLWWCATPTASVFVLLSLLTLAMSRVYGAGSQATRVTFL